MRFEFRTPPRSGEDVVSFRGVHKGYGAQPIYSGLDLRLRLGFHVAVRLWETGALELGARGELETRTRGGGAVDNGTELDHAAGLARGLELESEK